MCETGSTSYSRTHVSTGVKGTFGYLDPEYFLTSRLTTKSDVYAFGVVMLEVLCGRPSIVRGIDEEQCCLVVWAQQCMKEKTLDQIIDPILRDQITPKRLMLFAELAIKCLHSRPNERPTMANVLVSLECALDSDDGSDDQCRVSSSEEDINVAGVVDEQIDENIQEYNALPVASIPSTSIPVQYNENSHLQKRSEGMFSIVIQSSLAFLPKAAETRYLNANNREMRAPNEAQNYSDNPDPLPLQSKAPCQLLQFTFQELKFATRNFGPDSILGEGRFGSVFKVWIEENGTAPAKPGTGITVVVKRLTPYYLRGRRECVLQVNFLGQLHHPNLVKFIGFCIEDDQRLLVYEYMARGSLDHHLFRRDIVLPWPNRIKIALGAAKGLTFLHGCLEPVIFGYFKTSNILLDLEYNAKLSDFGFAKAGPQSDSMYVSTRVMRTYHYAAPEYIASGHLTSKCDVYGFGVVLIEILTGRGSIDGRHLRGEHNLVDWARPYLAVKRKVYQLVDSRLKRNYSREGVQQVAQLAYNCINPYPKARPSMDETVKVLSSLQDLK